jgi:hypothetical protein
MIGPQRTKPAPTSFQWFRLANLIARWAACLKKEQCRQLPRQILGEL